MNLRLLAPTDLGGIAAIHRAAFPLAAISRLGDAAARRYYDSLMSDPDAMAGLGAFEGDRLSGFCFMGIRHDAEAWYVRHHGLFLAWRIATHPRLLTEPFVRGRIRDGLRLLLAQSPPAGASAPGGGDSGPSYGIQYLAVDPARQGRGVGQKLLRASEERARRHGHSVIHLSVYPDNLRAITFYERMGWCKRSSEGVWKGFMAKRLAPEESN